MEREVEIRECRVMKEEIKYDEWEKNRNKKGIKGGWRGGKLKMSGERTNPYHAPLFSLSADKLLSIFSRAP